MVGYYLLFAGSARASRKVEKQLEIEIHQEPDSSSDFSNMLVCLNRCQKELEGGFIDVTQLKTISPDVNWKLLYEESKDV
jgi:hypothetical protein